jgi:predicted RNase H-like HicB family nuclease
VIVELPSTGLSADSPDAPGCAAMGDTPEEPRASFQEALELHFDAMRPIGEPIPEPASVIACVELPAA